MRHLATLLTLLIGATVLACGGGPAGPSGDDSRTLAEGRYEVEYTGCFGCPTFTTPGFLLAFRDGETGIIRVERSTADTTRIVYEQGPSSVDDGVTLDMEWTTVVSGDPGYVGRFDICFGENCPAVFTQVLRRESSASDLSCSFAIFYVSGPGIGDGRCEVRRL